ncbi:Cyclic diguanosine monophosphate-binding protein [Vibrio aerogenes CECT 7868]|uniref:Cyclic diguanosine monophosphate-binding protein n=1 Tax=Vibrio aerogenes CECT 7868 TaxID=1216006 RepID=A0A1M5Y747_9VIBR|nr:PilZ domain-containing protein [Vibrio aerogenes]SHI07887.1 Cyclic diguanosine monophosphate-binding protein [Vibrio aerogenes CECT 7868]
MAEKRRFSRIVYRTPALVTQNQIRIAATVRDLSLHGILLAVTDEPRFNPQKEVEIEFPIPDSEISIRMSAKIISMDDYVLRASIEHIDLESISHLRRLVELNVGNDDLLHRELEYLSDLGDETNQTD